MGDGYGFLPVKTWIRDIVILGTIKTQCLETRKRTTICNSLALLTSICALAVVGIFTMISVPFFGIISIIGVAVVILTPIFLNKAGAFTGARISHVLIANGIVILLPILFGLECHFQFYFLVLIGVPLIFFGREIGQFKWLLVIMTIPGWILVQNYCAHNPAVVYLDSSSQYIVMLVNNVLQFVFISSLYYFFVKQSDSHLENLARQKNQLELTNGNLDVALEQATIAARSKSVFLANMSHEIRTPLNGVIVASQVLKSLKLDEAQADLVRIISDSSENLLALINDILDYSKVEAKKLELTAEPFNLLELVENIVEQFKFIAADKELELISFVHSGLHREFISDGQRIGQVLTNLIGNAVKFCEKGQVLISVAPKEYIGHDFMRIEFRIEDTGIGISPEKLETIFESFVQEDSSTSRKYGGTGLGTTISKMLVDLLGGELQVESPNLKNTINEFDGSVFSFTLDLPVIAQQSNGDVYNMDFDMNQCLLIDQNVTSSGVYKQMLESWSLEVETSNEISKAEANVTSKPELIILNSPCNENWLTIAEKLKEDWAGQKIIVLSTEGYVQSMESGGPPDIVCVSKPPRLQDLNRAIRRSLGEVEPVSTRSPQVSADPADLKILVAEDNPMNQQVAEYLFASLGYEIEIANNGVEAVDMASSGGFDLIFMDYMMPEMDGLTATVELRKRNCDIPIIAMTANAFDSDRTRCLDAGMNDFLSKPVSVDLLRSVLTRWTESS